MNAGFPQTVRVTMLLMLPWFMNQASQAQQAPTGPNLAIQAYQLPNGLKVVLHKDTTVPRVSVCVAYHVGSKNEQAGRTGFAHFFEHMMFRGTKNVPNYDIPLQEAGAQSNAFTSEDMTVYFETVPSDFLERALYLEAERLAFLPSALDQDKFDTEREVVKNERRQSVDNVPYGQASEALLAALYPAGHPYSWSVIGSMKDLDSASLDDLRQFFYQFYHPGNATLCLAGDFDSDQARAWIARYFEPLRAGTAPQKVVGPPTPPVSKALTLADAVQMPRLYWTWPSVADDHPDAPALDLLASVLTGGDAARLTRALVRDQRVVQDVSADSDTHEIAGQFNISATAAEGQTIDAVREALGRELDKLRQQPPTAPELARALAKFEKSTYTSLTAPLGRAMILAIGYSQYNDPTWYRKDFDRYLKVSVGDLRRVANTYLVADKVELIVRPATEFDPPKKPIEAGPLPGPDTNPQAAALPDRTPATPGPNWAAMPGPSTPLAFQPPAFTRATLSNGVDVWIGSWHTLPIVSMRLLVQAGTADDPAGKSGLAALTGRLLEQGTEEKSATELAEALDTLGASLVVTTGPDHTAYNMSVLAHQLDPSLNLLSETLRRPRFDPADFDREKDLLLTDLRQGPDSPGWIAQRAFRTLLFGANHPYGNPAQGFISTVKELTLADVKQFHASLFGPKGAVIVVVGDVDAATLVPQLEKAIGAGWTGAGSGPKPRPEVTEAAKPSVVYLVDKPGAVQSVISVGRRWVDRADPSYFATLIGNRILGADFLSRLNQNLREEHGYSYGAGSTFIFRRSASTWSASTSVRADVTAESLGEVIKELNGLAADRPFTVEEINTARGAEAQSYPEAFESPAGIAAVLEEMATHHLPLNYVETYLNQLQATTSEQIEQAMTTVVKPEERLILVVGDRAQIEPRLKELGFSTIVPVDTDGHPIQK